MTHIEAVTIPATPEKSRYAGPRKLISWSRNEWLKILKMLAVVIFEDEFSVRVGGSWSNIRAGAMWDRATEYLPLVIERLLGTPDVTLKVVCDHTLAEQGSEINSTKLYQRADKGDRLEEYNEFYDAVSQAYAAIKREQKAKGATKGL